MASTLAAQLARLAATSINTVSATKQKSIYSQSLLYPPAHAVTQDIDTIYAIAIEGFRELVELDPRFSRFSRGIFSEASRDVDRFTQTAAENEELDRNIEDFLGLVGERLLLKGALKAVEWLVRKYRIQELNTAAFILTFLPYHTHPVFTRAIAIVPQKNLPITLSFLTQNIKPPTCPARATVLKSLVNHPDFFNLLTSHVLTLAAKKQAHHTLLSFYTTNVVDALNQMCGNATYSKNPEDIVIKVLPLLTEGLKAQHTPEFQISCYMIITVLVTKLPLGDKLLNSLMREVVEGWTEASFSPAFTALALLAQERTANTPLPSQVVSALLKREGLGQLFVDRSKKFRVDELAAGAAIGALSNMEKYGMEGFKLVENVLLQVVMPHETQKAVLSLLFTTIADGEIGDRNVKDEVAKFMVGISESSSGTTQLQRVFSELLESEKIDIEILELQLQTVIRQLPSGPDAPTEPVQKSKTSADDSHTEFTKILATIPKTSDVTSFLAPLPSELFTTLSHAFLHATMSTTESDMDTLFAHAIFNSKPANEAFTLSFLIKLWTSRLAPALARAAAIAQARKILVATSGAASLDYQALLPYIFIAFGDANRKVRAEAGNILLAFSTSLRALEARRKKDKSTASLTKIWGFDTMFGEGTPETEQTKWMETAETRKVIDGLGVLETLEEIVLDQRLFERAFANAIGKHGEMKSALKITAMAFFSSHVFGATDMAVKLGLLKLMNSVTTGAATKAKPSVEILREWISMQDYSIWTASCEAAKVDVKEMELAIANSIGSSSDRDEGAEILLDVVKGAYGVLPTEIGGMRQAACVRLKQLWPKLQAEVQDAVARGLFKVGTTQDDDDDDENSVAGDALDVLKVLDIPTELFDSWLQESLAALKSFTAGIGRASGADKKPDAKRTKTASENTNGDMKPHVALEQTVSRLTAILELFEAREAGEKEVGLLKLGFGLLGEVMNVAGEIGVGVGYLLQLILGNLSQIVDYIKTSKESQRKLDGSIRADILVNCIRSTSSPQVQNRALLLVAALADVAPEVVLHSVMPIFTFMGANVLRQDDEYSAHVIEQTVQRVIPPLVKSLHQQAKTSTEAGIVGGVSELVASFVTAYKHIPAHRRLRLFIKLTDTLGASEFLYVVIAMLAEKYFDGGLKVAGKEDEIVGFCKGVTSTFPEEVQLLAVVQYLDVIIEVLHQSPNGVANHIFEQLKDVSEETRSVIANKLLQVLAAILDNDKLRSAIAREFDTTTDVERLRGLFRQALEKVLALGTEYTSGTLRKSIGVVMENLLSLLSTPEFVNVVDSLISSSEFRRSALATFKHRVTSEYRTDAASRAAVLGLAPKIAEIVASKDASSELKGDALSCINAITTKHGKREPGVIVSLTDAVIGEGGLHSGEKALRVLAYVCLTDMAACLGGRFVPVLPKTVPFSLEMLRAENGASGIIQNAIFPFLEALVASVPSFMSSYVKDMFESAWVSAGSEEDDSSDDEDAEGIADAAVTKELRAALLDTIVKKMDHRVVMTALDATWAKAIATGTDAAKEHLETVQLLFLTASKSQVQKMHSLLGPFFIKAYSLRKQVFAGNEAVKNIDEEDVEEIEQLAIETALKMVLKLNDTIFKPMFLSFSDWASEELEEVKEAASARRDVALQSSITFYNLANSLSGTLKSLITDYYTFILPASITLLTTALTTTTKSSAPSPASVQSYTSLLTALATSFSTDDRDFWTTPSHFQQISPSLLQQLSVAPTASSELAQLLTTAIIELTSACAGTEDQLKSINSAVLKQLRHDKPEVRLAAVRTQMGLCERLGVEWLAMLPETVPYIAELLEDDEEEVERETQRWIGKVEVHLGEGELQAMLT